MMPVGEESWQEQGVELSYHVDRDGFPGVFAYWKGYEIGYAKFTFKLIPSKNETHLVNGDLQGWDVWIHPEWRRKGLATAMYQLAEIKTEKKITQNFSTPDGTAFWNQPNRPFGKP
jgi:GNAT superfamily N-acetyltransferase